MEWQAYGADGKAAEIAYGVYFDPFVGKSSNRQSKKGFLKSKVFDNKAPAALQGGTLYKYTILADGCPDKPLDPNIRIQR